MPTCIPNEVYANTGRSISGLPIWMERLLLRLSFAATERIVMTRNGEVSIAWLSGDRQTAPKLRIVPAVVEEFPSAEFYERLTALEPDTGIADRVPRLLYVGRLHRDKMVLGLIDMLAHLAGAGISVRLSIAGDGPERAAMQRRAEELKVADRIDWLGFVPNHELPALYRGSTLFVSTITGTALREAGLCGLPVVAYDADWVKKLLTHESTALLAPSGDSAELSRQVMRALGNGELRKTIGQNFHQMARERWSPEIVPEALRVMFGS
jgi:glycosyltransferase involved in cell wall biosynthesis